MPNAHPASPTESSLVGMSASGGDGAAAAPSRRRLVGSTSQLVDGEGISLEARPSSHAHAIVQGDASGPSAPPGQVAAAAAGGPFVPALRVRTRPESGSGCSAAAVGQQERNAAATVPADMAAVASHPAFAAALRTLEAETVELRLQCGGAATSLAAVAALLSATAAIQGQQPMEARLAEARAVAAGALRLAAGGAAAGALSKGEPCAWQQQPAGSASVLSTSGCCTFNGSARRDAVEVPMQELLEVLECEPWRLQTAFLARAAPDPGSPSFATQPRHSVVALTDLPSVLSEVMPGWSRQTVEYAAQQVCWHVNVVAYSSSSPLARGRRSGGYGSGSGEDGSGDIGCAPSNMLYAEMAAAMIAAADTEAGAGCAATQSEQALVSRVAEALLVRGDGSGGAMGRASIAEALQSRLDSAAAAGRPLSLAGAISALVDTAGGAVAAGDGRSKAWLAAALLPLVGGTAGAVTVPALSAAVTQLQRLAAAAQEAQRVREPLGQALGGSSSSGGGGSGSPAAFMRAIGLHRCRHHRSSQRWSQGSDTGVGALFAGPAPWRGAVSGHASTDTEVLGCFAVAEDSDAGATTAAAVDVLRLSG